jgi:cytoplasmic iron level regulating protein YaaA (DUF328/UPF0246 family)
VHILLPPSEGKTGAQSGPLLNLDALPFPELRATRRRVLSALTALCAKRPAEAIIALGLGPKQADDVALNARLRREPCGPAIEVYTGVIFESLGYSTLSAAHRRRAEEVVLIASALWGLVRPPDLIPPYRLSGGTTLPDIGTMRSAWRVPLGSVLRDVEGPVVDLRSGAYLDLAPPPRVDDWVTVRVVQERNGRRITVSHDNKSTKGRLARELLGLRRAPSSTGNVVTALSKAGYRIEEPGPGRLDVVTG